MVGWLSGRKRLLGVQVCLKGYPGFESLPHRQNNMGLLSQEEINTQLKDLPGWQLDGQFLRKEFILPTFTDAMVFVNELAQTAEDMSHYPDIRIHQNTVQLSTTTPDLSGVTDKDMAVVKRAQEAEKSVFGELSK